MQADSLLSEPPGKPLYIRSVKLDHEKSKRVPEKLPHAGMKPRSPTSQTDSLLSEPPGKPNRLLIADIQIGKQYPVLLVDFFLALIIALCLH